MKIEFEYDLATLEEVARKFKATKLIVSKREQTALFKRRDVADKAFAELSHFVHVERSMGDYGREEGGVFHEITLRM